MIGTNSDKNDPFEEFEFRPINEGLGFHHKTKTAASAAPTSAAATSINPVSKSASPFQTALPRNEFRSDSRPEARFESKNQKSNGHQHSDCHHPLSTVF